MLVDILVIFVVVLLRNMISSTAARGFVSREIVDFTILGLFRYVFYADCLLRWCFALIIISMVFYVDCYLHLHDDLYFHEMLTQLIVHTGA